MKKLMVFLAILLAVAANSFAVVVDVKVPNNDKIRLSGIEIGVMYYLNDNGINVFDVGEDYAVWLTLVKEETVGNNQRLSIKIEITRPSLAFKSKQILASRDVIIDIPKITGENMSSTDNSFLQFAREKAVDFKDQKFLDGQIGGKIIANQIIQMLNGIRK